METGTASIDVRELRDRADIEACIVRSCRGADRHDVELLLSAYHDNATHHHPGAFDGSAQQFVDWFASNQSGRSVQHSVSNFTIDITGDVAHVESYVTAVSKKVGESAVHTIIGRYIDRAERRNGQWRIAHRLVLVDLRLVGTQAGPVDETTTRLSTRDRSDTSYVRPLKPLV